MNTRIICFALILCNFIPPVFSADCNIAYMEEEKLLAMDMTASINLKLDGENMLS